SACRTPALFSQRTRPFVLRSTHRDTCRSLLLPELRNGSFTDQLQSSALSRQALAHSSEWRSARRAAELLVVSFSRSHGQLRTSGAGLSAHPTTTIASTLGRAERV